LALAAQSTVENLFGGISIFADRPFRVGDRIQFGGNTGKVESIGPRSTRIRSADGSLTTVPNADLAKSQLVNLSARPNTLFQHRICLPGGIPSARLEALLADLRRRVAAPTLLERSAGTAPRVQVIGFGPSERDIEVEVTVRLATTDGATFLEAQEDLILGILRGAEANGIALSDAA
jgi:MscS family membrane protein